MYTRTHRLLLAALCLLATVAAAGAQQTTGTIAGRVLDEQKAAVPGATVTAKNDSTGFSRTEVSDAEGLYRITGLPVGSYALTIEMSGFQPQKRSVQVNVSETVTSDFDVRIAQMSENITVRAESPLVDTTSSAVGGVVDVRRVENLPLNGRQFANLAVTIPGVGLGYHSDPTKSTQFSPQINGGNGRNVNYQIDGGDNNDDTVGGLLQLFPLEAIQEFNFLTSRYKAEYGRSNGGVMNIVTKSGTNDYRGSAFELFRDKSMNAKTETERRSSIAKQDYRRNQFGGSVGGPIVRDRAHFFAAVERTNQDTTQAVTTKNLFPAKDGIYATPYRETLFTGKATANLTPRQYLTVRYGRNNNTQPYGATPLATPDNWGDSKNRFNSINLNHNLSLSGSKFNEFVFQYADFDNHISARSNNPYESFPNGVTTGQNVNSPQSTAQKKYQFRDDFSWHAAGMGGLGHDFKAGVNFINEPRLFITFNTGKGVIQYNHLTDDVNGPISGITLNDGDSHANIPVKQYATYIQDDWRVTDRLTLNLGLRYDLVTGLQFDQSKNPNYVLAQQLGAAGRFANVVGYEDFGKAPKDDTNNWQPRVGGVWDVRGDAKDLVRAGWGIYTDFGYTNSNVLFAAADASGSRFGTVFTANNTSGIRNPDGSFYRVGQPLTNLAAQNEAGGLPLFGQWVDPLLEQPETRQASIGWSHELMPSTVLTADYVHIDGRNLNVRPRLNTQVNGGARRFADIAFSPNSGATRAAISRGKSDFDGLILGVRRRLTRGVDFTGSYTLSRGRSTIGTAGDELDTRYILDSSNPFDDPRMLGPNRRTDARHRVTASATMQLPMGFRVAPIFIFRSALPVYVGEGVDLNRDGELNDLPERAVAFDGFDSNGVAKFKDIGACETIVCGRGAPFSQMNVRVSRTFRLAGHTNIEAIGEVFNLFNAINPANIERVISNVTQTVRLVGGVANPNFMQPSRFAGDFQQPEQRVGQIGIRFTF
jgi:carboxypeptidase family protein/TonB-dependent receptor-like protein